MNESYYYGQGKVYLARRDINGRHGSWRFIGDVSALNVNFAFAQKTSKSTRGGIVYETGNHFTDCSAVVTSVWHDFSVENLAILLGSTPITEPFSLNGSQTLAAGIVKGETYSLQHTTVFNVNIAGLKKGIDYHVDQQWGMIEFLDTPVNKSYVVTYEYLQNQSLPFFTTSRAEFSLRYQGVNLAENNTPILVELYRLVFEPLATLELINSGDNVLGMETSAKLLADMAMQSVSELSYFGRIQMVRSQPSLIYNGLTSYDGRNKFRGK
ncbi:hypothetical protein [Serratia fonticola]|uniref:phage tail tube protein n=1 Tax=Serratia fonticola TaxID=47917 RepID=UPI0027E9F267|nr:hypothetical protein [Serratia fonticola]MDQ7212559.1 hypothetical protein [Serratia fonticola]HBE9082738.1 hypothetical protein [Serratia fonticola]HBE9093291.1 hypothetical protein [Serratia fonticola]HBE9155588.1 hypothetical protein [Serratia fonticola]